MGQSRNRRRVVKAQPNLDKAGLTLQQTQVLAEGLALAHNGVLSVMQDMKQVQALVHAFAQHIGMSEDEVKKLEADATKPMEAREK